MMTLHQNQQLFRQSVLFTSQQKNIPENFVEKDYWVMYVLHTIFSHSIGEDTIFKGGTALLKCYRLIERFSEDIDLIVIRRTSESNNRLSTKIKEISSVVDAILPEVILPEVTQKTGMRRKTAHSYPQEFKGDFRQVKKEVVVEATWLGHYEPYTIKNINTFIYEMMVTTGQEAIAINYGLQPFAVKVLEPQRTFCEKIMSLVRFSYTADPIQDLKSKIRHTYDLYQLLQDDAIAAFFNDSAFDDLLLKVAEDDMASFKNNNAWLVNHPANALIFKEIEVIWDKLSTTYSDDFRSMVFGKFPTEENIYTTLQRIQQRLSLIDWTIKIDDM